MRTRTVVFAALLCAPLGAFASSRPPTPRTKVVAKTTQPALVQKELGSMTEQQAGANSDGLYKFIANRDTLKNKHFNSFVALASTRLQKIPGTLVNPTAPQADALFSDMSSANLGTHVPDDYCYARAEIAARAAMAKGFAVRKVNFVAADGTMLKVKTKNTLTGAQEWTYHVAPVVTVDGVDYVIDPSLDSGKITVAQWEAKMGNPNGKSVITDAKLWSYGSTMPATVQAQVSQLAESLWIVGGVREYEQFRMMDLHQKN